VLPAVVASPFDFVGWVSGAYGGEDARMPFNLTGLTGVTKRGAQILNTLGYQGLLPAGMGRDAQGNFHPFSEIPLEELTMQIGGMFGRPMTDLYAPTKARIDFHLQQLLLEAHPEWATDPTGAVQMEAAINQMKLDAEAGNWSEELLEAEQRANQDSVTGPDFPDLPEPLRGWVGGAVRALSPLRIMSEPELKTDLRAGSMPVGTRDSFDASTVKGRPYDTLELAVLNQNIGEYYDGDGPIADTKRTYDTIAYHNLTAPITVYGKTYSNADLELMTEAQRYDVADEYLKSQGFTSADLEQHKADQKAFIESHPDMGAYLTFKDTVRDYPGGLNAFVDEAVRTSPSYARHMAQTGYQPGTPDYYAAGDNADAFYALEGKRGSIYDPTELPPTGTIPGQPPGMTFAMKRALEDNADAAASSGGGDGNDYTDFVGDVQRSVDSLYNAQQMVDAWFPGAGYVAGVTYFDYDTYKAMQAAGYNAPKKGDIAYEYNDWLLGNATTTDPSVKAFLDQRESASGTTTAGTQAENVTPDMILAQRNTSVDVVDASVPRTDTGAMDTAAMPWVAVNQEMPLASGPSLDTATPLTLPVGLRLKMVRMSADGQWAYVIAPGDTAGWIPTVALNTA
jgi:hypothetical protein